MWHYTGPEDSTRTNVEGILEEKVTSWVLQITGPCENPKGARRVTPYSADNPPPNQEWTNWSSPVSNGNPEEEEEEGIQEGSMESAEYVTDSGESEEENIEEEDEDEESDSPPPRPEHRSKRRHEPRHPSALLRRRKCSPLPMRYRVVEAPRGPGTQPLNLQGRIDLPWSLPKSPPEPALEAAFPPPPPPTPRPIKCLPDKCFHRNRAPVGEELTGANLGMPHELSTIPGSSNAEFCIRSVEQVGAAKGAMIQVELMAGEAKRAYDSVAALYRQSLELRDDIRKTCEMGTAYEALRTERNQYAGELEAAMLAMAGMKSALEVREKSLEEALEANRVLVAEVERLKKQRTELHNQMAVQNKRWTTQEKYVNDWAVQMMSRLADFCTDAEAEAAAVERSMKDNVPLNEGANRDLLRAHIRVGKVGPFISRLREVFGRIEKELWPEDESRQEMGSLLARMRFRPSNLEEIDKTLVPMPTLLSLVRVHCKEVGR
ncbi:hypothetical protein ZWY2020_037590 [Hordeum vulgare]|nr:hypothetical protein ZWY2020_037590 [Hordeum vulgare]